MTVQEQPLAGTMPPATFQVVILAAGLGTRLGRSLPKPLTVLRDGRTILQRQLDCLHAAFGEDVDVTLVVGHQAGLLMLAAPDAAHVPNPDFRRTNTSKSLLRALRCSRPGGVLWLNGDVVFDPRLLEQVTATVGADRSFVCVDTAAVGDEEVKYTVDADGFVRDLSKSVVDGLGEAVGINYVGSADKAVLIEHLERCADDDYFERGLETAIGAGSLKVLPIDISAYPAVEVDCEEDLARANDTCV
ncbi:phosphocholine cytidylyltransferase family protein [Kribbella swartbergensis]